VNYRALIEELELYREELVQQLAEIDVTLKILNKRPWLDKTEPPLSPSKSVPCIGSPKLQSRGAGAKIDAPPIKEALLAAAATGTRTSTELGHAIAEQYGYNLASVQTCLYQLLRDRQLVKGDDLIVRAVSGNKIQNLPELPKR
jgi:hypothetical protein